jgi:hypothetical protein
MAVTKINILTVLTGRRVDLHSIGTMMGFPAAKLWQNETFHCHTNQMNISTS